MAHARLAVALLGLVGAGGCGVANAEEPELPAAALTVESGLAVPAGWQALPTLAEAARTALVDPAAVDGAEAWGDPALGCYAVWWSMRGQGIAPAIAERVLAGLGGDVAITASAVKAPKAAPSHPAKLTDVAWLDLAFERKAKPEVDLVSGVGAAVGAAGSGSDALTVVVDPPPLEGPPSTYRGTLRAKLGDGHVVVIACFANEREPAACAAPCTTLLAGLK